MEPREALAVSVSQRGSPDPGSDPVRIVIWVRGAHDVSTSRHLSAIITRAARLDDVDVVVDLSGITFMDASTIGTVVEAHNRLRARSRVLCIRAPSPIARRLLDVCDLGFLVEEHPRSPSASALGSWVAVPASDPPSGATSPPPGAPSVPEEPARATTWRPGEAVAPAARRRTRS